MRQTHNPGTATGDGTGDLAALHGLYAGQLRSDGSSADGPAGLDAVVASIVGTHRRLAAHRAPAGAVVATGVSDGPGSGTVFDVICDEMPFVVESLLAGLDRVGARARYVVHPVVKVRRDRGGDLVEVLEPGSPAAAGPGATAELWIHVETDLMPVDEAEDLVAELHEVLRDVREVAAGEDAIAATARSVAAELLESLPAGPGRVEQEDAARLLEWLAGGRIAFLGHRRYEIPLDHSAEPSTSDSGRGVLRRDEVARRIFDGIAPGTTTGAAVLVISRAGAASRVFRPRHPSVLAVRMVDSAGRAVREHRFVGALTTSALHEDVLQIPGVGRRVGRRCSAPACRWSRTPGSGCSR